MSGSPKYVSPSLTAAIRATISEARRVEAQQEMRLRRSRADEWMRQREMQRRNAVMDQATALEHELAAVSERLSPADEMRISDEINRARATASNAANPDMANIEAMLVLARRQLTAAVDSARQQAAQRSADEREAFRGRITALQERMAALEAQANTKLEERAVEEARQALYEARASVRGDDPVMTDYHIRLADKAIDRLEVRVQHDAERERRERQELEDRLAAWESCVAGLQADTTVMRWLPGEVAAMDERTRELRAGNAAAVPDDLAQQAQAKEQELVEKANAAQVKADQRDYIARGIRETLAEMGFLVSEATEEHPGHPATALAFTAVNDMGQGISVSVPVEGEVFYDIDGYTKSTVTKVGGGSAAVCDSAEQVITEMHELLEQGFQVQMGELMWEGKDPDRILRMADELPGGGERNDREDSW
ncbi:MAG: hypothetical protein H7A35_08510 [Planctomycetales bacterium]|nr:hypothetical protein [bacterium]UNM06926.1 MAG: hypothetical protein H7A35_08510 [Planctomycetales bacterium]